jgi:hypothetical protein
VPFDSTFTNLLESKTISKTDLQGKERISQKMSPGLWNFHHATAILMSGAKNGWKIGWIFKSIQCHLWESRNEEALNLTERIAACMGVTGGND